MGVNSSDVMRSLFEALLTDGLVFVDGLPDPSRRESVWAFVDRMFQPKSVSHEAFWDARGVVADAHLNNFTCLGSTDKSAGFHASYGVD